MEILTTRNRMVPHAKYDITGMSLDLAKIQADPSDRVWTVDTIYHNINIILNKWFQRSSGISIGVFKSPRSYGPKVKTQDEVDIWIHPFKWKTKWHLVIGINPYNKIILINCTKASREGFPPEACIVFEKFITFFQSKVTKEALQYPKLCSDFLDPTSEDNGLNLLTTILTFCLRPDTLVKLFCDPNTPPRQFDVSDLIPHVIKADTNFRKTLKSESLSDLESDSHDSDVDVEEAVAPKQENKLETTPKKRPFKKSQVKENPSRSSNSTPSFTQKSLRSTNGSNSNPIDLDELEDEEEEEVEQTEAKKRRKEDPSLATSIIAKQEKRSSAMSQTMQGERDKKIKKETTKLGPSVKAETALREPSILDVSKSDSTRTSVDGESSEEEDDDEDEEDDNMSSKKLTLAELFKPRLFKSFSRILRMTSFTECKTEIDIILEGVENWTHSRLTNPQAKEEDSDMKKWGLLIRENLIVEFTRRTKREFDEDELTELLEIDHHNEMFPLFFENNTVFLINFNTKDGFRTSVNIIVVSTRPRGEREIMKNYAFKRIVEMYVWKYMRLVTRIRTSIITVTNGSPYEIFMVTLHCIHRFVMNSKFDIKFAPMMYQVEAYMESFETVMQAIKTGQDKKRETAFRSMIDQLR